MPPPLLPPVPPPITLAAPPITLAANHVGPAAFCTQGLLAPWPGRMDLEKYRVGELATLYYIPNAVSPAEEERLLREIRASKQQWKSVSGRRLQSLGGMVHKQGLIPAPLPSYLDPLLSRLAADTGIFGSGGERPNHVLVNSYQVRLTTVCVCVGRIGCM